MQVIGYCDPRRRCRASCRPITVYTMTKTIAANIATMAAIYKAMAS